MTVGGVIAGWIVVTQGAAKATTIWAANLAKLKQVMTMIQTLTGAATALGAAVTVALAAPIKEEQLSNITSADLEEGASAIAGFIGKTTVEIKTGVQTQCDAIDEERDKLVKKLRGLIDPTGELDWNDADKVAEFIGKDVNAQKLKGQLDSVEMSAAKQKEDVRQKAQEEAEAKLAQLAKDDPYNAPDKAAEQKINEVRAAAPKNANNSRNNETPRRDVNATTTTRKLKSREKRNSKRSKRSETTFMTNVREKRQTRKLKRFENELPRIKNSYRR